MLNWRARKTVVVYDTKRRDLWLWRTLDMR